MAFGFGFGIYLNQRTGSPSAPPLPTLVIMTRDSERIVCRDSTVLVWR